MSGKGGDKLRDTLNSNKLQKYNFDPNAFTGISKPSRSNVEARRGDFSRSNSSSIGSNHHLQQRSTFDRNDFGGANRSSHFRSGSMGGMGGGRMHMRRR